MNPSLLLSVAARRTVIPVSRRLLSSTVEATTTASKTMASEGAAASSAKHHMRKMCGNHRYYRYSPARKVAKLAVLGLATYGAYKLAVPSPATTTALAKSQE